MVLSVELLKGSVQWPDMELVRCAGHTLQLCVNAALKEDPVSRTVAVARRLVGHFKKGHKAKTGLKEKQVQQKAPEHELIQDVDLHLLYVEATVGAALAHHRRLSDPNYTKRSDSNTLDMTTEQWNMAEDITDVLKPIITLTELLSEETNTSLSAAFPMLENLKKCNLAA
ncbi:hypothetical protein DPEC_G00096680 [Dallia pectoralis]|uniref:Uncharacterized protein n=1 Tax=Dallia pectoralis TaxID=75939 RepID=A0ACC2GVX1_DALPE|nr:hypothetical protein DPEC_G00096680 [Dallia pectoralis]